MQFIFWYDFGEIRNIHSPDIYKPELKHSIFVFIWDLFKIKVCNLNGSKISNNTVSFDKDCGGLGSVFQRSMWDSTPSSYHAYECDLVWKLGLCTCSKCKTALDWSRNCFLLREEERHRDKCRGNTAIWSWRKKLDWCVHKECQGFQTATKSSEERRKNFSLELRRKPGPSGISVGILPSVTVRPKTFYCF